MWSNIFWLDESLSKNNNSKARLAAYPLAVFRSEDFVFGWTQNSRKNNVTKQGTYFSPIVINNKRSEKESAICCFFFEIKIVLIVPFFNEVIIEVMKHSKQVFSRTAIHDLTTCMKKAFMMLGNIKSCEIPPQVFF